MISSMISRTSAVFLGFLGFALLFAPLASVRLLVPGFPSGAAWLGQCIGAGWLTVAWYDWNTRETVMGGVYGRLSVNLNLVLYLISALAMLKAPEPTLAMRVLTVPFVVLATAYGVLMLRGPFARDLPRP